MIFILHGQDREASYNRLLQIFKNYPKYHKVKLTKNDRQEAFYLAVFAQDLIEKEKIVSCENFLSDKKVKFATVKTIPREITVIFWEHKQLAPAQVGQFQKIATVENFSLSQIFRFLDSISPNAHISLEHLHSSKLGSEQNLIWQLTNRLFLLILAKNKANYETASKLASSKLLNWQWQKVITQAQKFDLKTLYAIYHGAIKLDFMLKTGAANLDKNSLVSLLLIKYLAL
ncbi:MAG: hypothetical protein ACD_57C00190G0001 [uncultured bacterium]|uniref:DNA polymerase III delta N-terminal domain-containing protein n=1 Tax=Candidatus Curtissbacteria bacterium RIFOXYA1_FULL_41_14 TaxID=1797737 RepID=A0A1F5HBE0_9BACT|nr:MAG: hypothetical protein ACD_57C00190G0001 [uncultured bacterium]KKR58012.1 MAG: hypothetical protein UT95_C0011G0008 [Candidatus Curtissbacteria bacterium GW2011_GWB1_40_28]KKR60966.1 MAG: hypothetical protein UT99_C0004G0012 [Candidatus Curtissbacteria bacterium GW2011_GWA2_40_31]KKR61818.1 MAG: hypothetical protein UU00_C0007G0020 [Microgenomates group bacterium GW2011_GWC1_40_35]KKR65864.1 MAG: hypothetical protein UU05_C0009G0009 [Candidatus Curtissbacteria bacterium GW2011_GWA1_40_47]